MTMDTWWPRLPPATRDWLIANNGSPVPAEVVEQIEQAGGPSPSDPWRTRDENSCQIAVPDSAADWIEAIANEETPEAR